MKLNTTKIKILLAEREMNQSDFAIKLGVNRQYITEVLSRETCSLKTLGRIAKTLDVPVAAIVKEE